MIAQVVLEKATKRSNGRLIRQCMSDYAGHLRTAKCGTLVRQIVMTLADLQPLALAGDTEALRKAVFNGVRHGLRTVDNVAGAIQGLCGGDYRELAEWMKVLRLLIPRQSRDVVHLPLIEIHQDLLDAADRTFNPPNPQLLEYYRQKIECLRAWLLDEDDYEFLIDAVHHVAPFIGAPWCRADFYADVFRWSFQALKLRWTENLTGPEAVDGRFLYSTLFTVYEHLRSLTAEDRIEDIRRDFNTMMLRYVHWQLPDEATDLIQHAWETSIALGCPDAQAGTLYAELVLAGHASELNEVAVASACRVLEMVLNAFPSYGEALFLLALARSRHGDQADSLPDRIVGAAQTDSDLNHAFLVHAAALSEPDAFRRGQLLLDAANGYVNYIEAQRLGSYAADRLRFACTSAFADLAAIGGSDVERALQRYRRLASLAGDD